MATTHLSRQESYTLKETKGKVCLFQPTLSQLSNFMRSRMDQERKCNSATDLSSWSCLRVYPVASGCPQKIKTQQGGAEHGAGLPLHRPNMWQIYHQSPITLTFQSQYRSPVGRRYRTVDVHQHGFPLRRTNIPLGNSLETQRKTVPPKSGMQGPPKGIFLGALTSMSILVTLFHFLYSTIFSFFFHSYFSFFFSCSW